MKRPLKYTAKTSAFLALFALCGCLTTQNSKTPTEQAMLSLTTGEFDKAVVYSQEALKENPNDVYALTVAGIAYDNLGYPHRSRRYYEDVLALPNSGEAAMFGQFKKMPPQDLHAVAAQRLSLMEQKAHPFTKTDPETGIVVFTKQTPKGQESFSVKKEPAKGGIDMLSEGDKNIVNRFLTFIRLRDEKLVTQEEWEIRRQMNLGGLMPYSLQPAGIGMDLPSPEADEIIRRLDALRAALELRSITPKEHAVEREMILEALLVSKPRGLMSPKAPPEGILDGAQLLRRLEMLQGLGLITPQEAAVEKKATENLIYSRLGMDGGQKVSKSAAPCIQKCLQQSQFCPQSTPVAKKKTAVKKKPAKKVVKKKAPAPIDTCSCPVP